MRQAAAEGVDVVLITTDKLRDADWPKDVLAESTRCPSRRWPSTRTWGC